MTREAPLGAQLLAQCPSPSDCEAQCEESTIHRTGRARPSQCRASAIESYRSSGSPITSPAALPRDSRPGRRNLPVYSRQSSPPPVSHIKPQQTALSLHAPLHLRHSAGAQVPIRLVSRVGSTTAEHEQPLVRGPTRLCGYRSQRAAPSRYVFSRSGI